MESIINKNIQLPEVERRGLFKSLYYTLTNAKLVKKEYYFQAEDLVKLVSAVKTKNMEALRSLHRRPDSNLKLTMLRSKDGAFIAAQVLRYQPFEFTPEMEIVLLKGEEAKSLFETLEGMKASF